MNVILRKHILLLFICCFFFSFKVNAQKETNNWLFLVDNALNFNCTPPRFKDIAFPINYSEFSSMSDQYGKLLFYTDGYVVYDNNNEVMMNGNDLLDIKLVNREFPDAVDRRIRINSIIIPKPNNPNIYYIFYCVPARRDTGLYYAEVNMDLNGGFGGVSSKRNLLKTNLTGALSAVEGKDCYWLVTHGFNSKNFFSFKITATGIEIAPVVSTVGSAIRKFINPVTGTPSRIPVQGPVGFLKIAPNGKKITSTVTYNFLELFDFNDLTGKISNAMLLSKVQDLLDPEDEVIHDFRGIEFSSNSKVLYVLTRTGDNLFQYNLESNNIDDIIASKTNVFIPTIRRQENYGGLQLASNGKIYFINRTTDYFGAINNPNKLGEACNFEEEALNFQSDNSGALLPNFMQSYFKQFITFDNVCIGDITEFSLVDQADTVFWDFGDPDSGTNNTSIEKSPTHEFSKSGVFYVTVTTTNGSKSTTDVTKVIINEPVFAYAVPDQRACDDGVDDTDGIHEFDTSNIENLILLGQTGVEVKYYNSEGKRLFRFSKKPFKVNRNETITAEVRNIANCVCTSTTDINFIVNPLPEFSVESTQFICFKDPDNTVLLDPNEMNANEVFDYQWTSADGSTISKESTIEVSSPGVYTVNLTTTKGCSRKKDFIIKPSETAHISLNDILIKDLSLNNRITINTTNLGIGDYEFSIDDEFSNYQDNPIFYNVSIGKHIIYVRDKNGCGIVSIEISVIGFPRFFTPNGDGSNDYWQIKDEFGEFKAQSISIFNRYGKLLKYLDLNSKGWDGNYNGKPLPSGDYWFNIVLEDNRVITNHITLKR